ncbi:TPA: hypothetical protein N0F65_002811 [Lagenidium giganteum]|uniref:Elicitin n=1 Tax=Lagenidium giganteum TaxID=4803 RepID=A0AAV2Z7L1_9STRA|nr:TPA: hypothetical protein N0F65_002811 [Lagenidium giganteum]
MHLATIVAALTCAVATAADCDLFTLTPIVADAGVNNCSADASYDFVNIFKPSDAQVDKMCASKACMRLLQDILGKNPMDCVIPVGGRIRLRADLLDVVATACRNKRTASSQLPTGTSLPPSSISPSSIPQSSTPATHAPIPSIYPPRSSPPPLKTPTTVPAC